MRQAPTRTVVHFLLPLAMLSACSADRADVSPPAMAPVERGDASIEWRGMLVCADCDGIDTSLVLVRTGDTRRFVLSETYLGDDDARFVTNGQWRRERSLLHLRAEQGTRITYAVLADGRLQPTDAHGRVAQAVPSDVLVPVAATGPARATP